MGAKQRRHLGGIEGPAAHQPHLHPIGRRRRPLRLPHAGIQGQLGAQRSMGRPQPVVTVAMTKRRRDQGGEPVEQSRPLPEKATRKS
ncbi:hypothetical protein THSYN_16795 [Candidatus Thiodictyon syntrophicum]|uniref:Uncharacterized protein n=1 Tax=Candidatus Thiodictyon syntrophicum TaxID=1166950 RepID=A0A2K8UA67_9GAMM|nr:hypothetical protein THSYN_16795 [Candidatus Thiodictyon syntrophicum]